MSYYEHVRNDKVKWVITFIFLTLLTAAVVGLCVGLTNQLPDEINAHDFKIGALNSEGKFTEDSGSIVMKNLVSAEGLTCEISEDAEISYKIFFFDKNKDFVSSTEALEVDYTQTAPTNAVYAKVVIIPLDDAEVSSAEIKTYVNMLTITLAE